MTNDAGHKPEGAPERSPKAGVGGPSGVDRNGAKRFSVQRKMATVAWRCRVADALINWQAKCCKGVRPPGDARFAFPDLLAAMSSLSSRTRSA